MAKTLKAIRGMNDILPTDMPRWHALENHLLNGLKRFGFNEIRMPALESTTLFKRSVGEATDIVEKEMYTFEDLNGDSLSLRPEGTAGCLRAAIEHGLLYNQIQKLYYVGPMYRHERPQKGRYRQFYQLGVEFLGADDWHVELELLLLCQQFWQDLGLTDFLTLEINSLGNQDTRKRYADLVVEYFNAHVGQLDDESKQRLARNPLRVLDSKKPALTEIIANAPLITDCWDEKTRENFEALTQALKNFDIAYTHNPHLMRGLDYYSDCVFEWTTDRLGAQGTVCAGGRYDRLVEILGGRANYAAGFALGLERLLLLLEATETPLAMKDMPAIYIITAPGLKTEGYGLAKAILSAFPDWQVLQTPMQNSIKSQFKQADKSAATWALVLGEDEQASGAVILKHLRDRDIGQVSIDRAELIQSLQAHLTAHAQRLSERV